MILSVVSILDHLWRMIDPVDDNDAMLRHLTRRAFRLMTTATGRRDCALHGEAIRGGR